MKALQIIRSTFRIILLISLLFRLFFVQKLDESWNVASHTMLGVGLVGMIFMELIIYGYKRSKRI